MGEGKYIEPIMLTVHNYILNFLISASTVGISTSPVNALLQGPLLEHSVQIYSHKWDSRQICSAGSAAYLGRMKVAFSPLPQLSVTDEKAQCKKINT